MVNVEAIALIELFRSPPTDQSRFAYTIKIKLTVSRLSPGVESADDSPVLSLVRNSQLASVSESHCRNRLFRPKHSEDGTGPLLRRWPSVQDILLNSTREDMRLMMMYS